MRRAGTSLGVGLAVMVVVMLTAPGRQSDLWLFVGRFHPTLVHLPIGILLLAVGLELAARSGRFPGVEPAVPLALYLGAWAAILATTAGLLLAGWGGYPVGTLFWHRWLGVGVAAVAAWLSVVRQRSGPTRGYGAGLGLLGVGLVVGGHLGGTLTHGDGYLTDHLPDGVRRVAGLVSKNDLARLPINGLDTASAYHALIQPILTRRCGACHDPSVKKGGLSLATLEGILAGGKDGKVVLPGRGDQSELVQRLWLPPGHKDRMPPDRAIPIAEAELLRWWIDQGAPGEAKLAEIDRPARIERVLDSYGLSDLPTGIFTLKVPTPDSAAMAAARAAGLVLRPLANASHFLDVDARAAAGRLDLLRPLAAQVAWLDLGGTDAGDSSAAAMGQFPHLSRLHLERTRISDRTLAALADLQYLEYLNVYATGVTDAGLQSITGLRRLKALYLWQTHVTPAAADSLRRSRPHLAVNLGGGLADTTAAAKGAPR